MSSGQGNSQFNANSQQQQQGGSSGQQSGSYGPPSHPGYQVTSHGTNSQGNHHCTRDYGPDAPNSYHYSNSNGSYYYQNPDGSNYYNDGQGSARYRRN